MLQVSRFTTRKLLQHWNIKCPVRLYRLSALTLIKSQRKLVCKTVFEASLFSHGRLGATLGPHCVWTRASTPFVFYSTSTDSKQAAESKVKTNDKPEQVSSDAYKKLFRLAYPERWRLSGKMHTPQLQEHHRIAATTF